MTKEEKNRTCIVTRNPMNRDEMIRFVVDPNNCVVPDLREKLPGRGVWITNRKSIVEKAVERNLFSAAFKSKVEVASSISQNIEKLQLAEIANGLSIARKAGLAISGFSKVDGLARRGDIKLVFHGSDGTVDGLNKIKSALVAAHKMGAYKKGVPQPFVRLSVAELDQALGMNNTVHVALVSGGATSSLRTKIVRIENYCG